tara:strand:- start:543 stop:968 length:426 start_codon:yes stop_codon:yes gene_type:complete
MKSNELKKVLKPLIKECIKEVIFEEGVLSSLISEVLKGTSSTVPQKLVESKKPKTTTNYKATNRNEDYKVKLRETKKKMLEAIGEANDYNGVNLFEGTAPLRKAGSPNSSASPTSPLDTYAPNDAGIDISAIFSSKWKNLV